VSFFFVGAFSIHLPIFLLIRHVQGGRCEHLAGFILWPLLIAVLLTLFILFYFGGTIYDLFSGQGFLFYCLFSAAGAALGAGFVYSSNWTTRV